MKFSYLLILIFFICSLKGYGQIIYQITTLAGSDRHGYLDSIGIDALFDAPNGISVDKNGNVFVADSQNYRIRKITPSGIVSTFSGNGRLGDLDGDFSYATYHLPTDVASINGYLFVCDELNSKIRVVSPTSFVNTFAGSGMRSFADGQSSRASFYFPSGIALASDGFIYIADSFNHRIRGVGSNSFVYTIAGNGIRGNSNGTRANSSFNFPSGVAVDTNGNVYVADRGNNLIRKISSTGIVSTLAGSGMAAYADGLGTAASFNYPTSLAVDADGFVYVTDSQNHRIRKISPNGQVTTILGSGSPVNIDGIGTASSINFPWGITIDSNGIIYISDHHSIRRITHYCNAPSTPSISPISPLVFCEGDSTILEAPESFSYQWSTGETKRRITIKNNSAVSLIVFNDYNCKSDTSETLKILVHPVPDRPVITAITDSIRCIGDSFTLKAPLSRKYLWTTGDTSQSITFTAPTSVSVKVANEFGCFSKESAMINLRYHNIAIPDLGKNNPWLCPQQVDGLVYSVIGQPNSTFTWDIVGGVIKSNRNSQITVNWTPGFNISRNLSVTETTEYGCKNGPITIIVRYDSLVSIPESGCTLDDFALEIPNVILPNSEVQANKSLTIKNLFLYPNSSMKIYNRWGSLVWKSDNYQNDWNAEGLPDGIYYFDFDSYRRKNIKGFVQVLR